MIVRRSEPYCLIKETKTVLRSRADLAALHVPWRYKSGTSFP